MSSKVEFLLNEALSLNYSERALIAHGLISSIDEPTEENVDREWLEVARKRLSELREHDVKPESWNYLKQKIRASKI